MQNAIICTFKRGRQTGHRRGESNVTMERGDGGVSVSCCLSCPFSTGVEFKLDRAVIIPEPGLVCFPSLISYFSLTLNFSTVIQNHVCPRGMTWCLVLFCSDAPDPLYKLLSLHLKLFSLISASPNPLSF